MASCSGESSCAWRTWRTYGAHMAHVHHGEGHDVRWASRCCRQRASWPHVHTGRVYTRQRADHPSITNHWHTNYQQHTNTHAYIVFMSEMNHETNNYQRQQRRTSVSLDRPLRHATTASASVLHGVRLEPGRVCTQNLCLCMCRTNYC